MNYTIGDINELSGIEFENLCQQLMTKMGFEVETTKASGDGGIDLIAYNHQPFTHGKYIVQCKRYTGSVGEPVIRDLYGVVMSERANKGILITTGTITSSATAFANGKQLELIDNEKLISLLTNHQVYINNCKTANKTIVEVLDDNFIGSDDYKNKISYLQSSPQDILVRAKLINNLSGYVLTCSQYIDNINDKLVIIKEIKKHIDIIGKSVNVSKKVRFLLDIYDMLYVQLSIIDGDILTALRIYRDLFSRNELLVGNNDFLANTGVVHCLFQTTFDMIQFLSALQNERIANEIFLLAKKLILLVQGEFSLTAINIDDDATDVQIEFAKKECNRIDNIKNPNSMFFISEYELGICIDYAFNGVDSIMFYSESYSIKITDKDLIIDKIGIVSNLNEISNKVNNLYN